MSTTYIQTLHPDTKIKLFLTKRGYSNPLKLTQTLQGSIWIAKQESSNKDVAIKIANRQLHDQSISRSINGRHCKISENIKSEAMILKYISSQKNCSKYIVKYIDFFKSKSSYYLVMENGGYSLFKFVCSAHKLIQRGYLDIQEWHKLVKIISKQMIKCVEYLHSINICHFDISLENFLINTVNIKTYLDENGKEKVKFCEDSDVNIKICDFGLANAFEKELKSIGSNRWVGKRNYMSPETVNRTKDGYNAKANDVWCLGVCLFMSYVGGGPFNIASLSDECFVKIINNQYDKLLKKWKREHHVNDDILSMFRMIFKYEDKRANIEQIANYKW